MPSTPSGPAEYLCFDVDSVYRFEFEFEFAITFQKFSLCVVFCYVNFTVREIRLIEVLGKMFDRG